MNTNNAMRRFLILSIAVPALAAADVIPEGAGIIYGKDHVFSLKAPKNWALDNTSAVKSGLHAVFFPVGSSWAKSKVVAYAQTRPIDTKVKSVQDAVDSLVADFHAKGHPNHKAEKDKEIKTDGGKVGIVYKFSGDKFGNLETVCYFQEKKTINFIVLSSRDKASFDDASEPFAALCKSYTYISDSFTEGTTNKPGKPGAAPAAPTTEPKPPEKKETQEKSR
jgi:hypothetical protein